MSAARSLLAQTVEIVHQFPVGGPPRAPLLLGDDGFFYGTSSGGGIDDQGFVFRIDGAGNFVMLHRFAGPEGRWPASGLVQGSDGDFYGTTQGGGTRDAGTIFRMDHAGDLVVLHDFDRDTEGTTSDGALIQATDGAFYGTTSAAGLGASGAVFRMDPFGFLTIIHSFSGGDGATSRAALLQASDGRFYGTTSAGGLFDGGTVFRFDQGGGGFVSLHSFNGNGEPGALEGPLIEGADGLLYGTGSAGGDGQGGGAHGSVFRMDGDGNITTIHFFSGLEGGNPTGGLLAAADGSLYGTAQSTAFRMDYLGGLVVIHTFVQEEGAGVGESLIQGPDGRLYGTALRGGAGGAGSVFALDLSGDCTVLHSFGEEEGQRPVGGLVEGADGFLYGANAYGGLNSLGTIFRMSLLGRVSAIHQFGPPDVGAYPQAALLRTADGTLFGTTGAGGAEGSLFRVSAGGLFTTLGEFGPGNPGSAVILASDGNLYGSTPYGGTGDLGTIFRIDSAGVVSLLHEFVADGSSPGIIPVAALIQGQDGALYGTTSTGGTGSAGTVFRIDLGGSLAPLHDFGGADGFFPMGSLIQTPDGSFDGTTQYGGTDAAGTVFKIDPTGLFSTVHSFAAPDGAHPITGLMLASDGRLYGTTPDGGSLTGFGTVYRIDADGVFAKIADLLIPDYAPPLGPLIEASDGNLYGGSYAVFRVILSTFAVTRLAPLNGSAAGGTRVGVGGAGFSPGATLSIGGVACPDAEVLDPTRIVATAPPLPPGSLNDVTVVNADASTATLAKAFFAEFLDSNVQYGFHDDIERLARYGITAGCGAGNFCPDATTTRAQAAVFLLRAEHGAKYAPPACVGIFADTQCPGPFTDWIEALAAEGIAAGCGDGNYCPDASVSRAQMAALLLRTLHGTSFVPPACAGYFDDVACPSLFADWIEELRAESISGGCLQSPPHYCPGNPVTRGQAAALLANAFRLP